MRAIVIVVVISRLVKAKVKAARKDVATPNGVRPGTTTERTTEQSGAVGKDRRRVNPSPLVGPLDRSVHASFGRRERGTEHSLLQVGRPKGRSRSRPNGGSRDVTNIVSFLFDFWQFEILIFFC